MIVDVHVNLSRWPFRRLRGDETPELVRLLRERGVGSAWAGSFDALLHKDVAGVNSRLADECARFGPGFLVPFGSVNPAMPDWEEDFRRCAEVHRMPGIRLHPNYHGYTLADPVFERLARLCAERRLILQIVLQMEDERTQHRLARAAPVDPAPLLKLLPSMPSLRLVISNGARSHREEMPQRLAAAGAHLDFAMLEGPAGVGTWVERMNLPRILFGSHFPFYTWESARLKVQEAGLTPEQERAILGENARKLL